VPTPFIVEIELDGPGLKVVSRTVHMLSTVVNPASMCLLASGDLIIGDGRDPDNPVPADLVRVKPGSGWAEGRLLASVAGNPLAAPVAVVREDDDHLYVLDAGIRPWDTLDDLFKRLSDPGYDRNKPATLFEPSKDIYNPFLRAVANQPAIYRVDLGGPTITRVSETGVLCRPGGMALLDGNLYVAERGMELLGELFDPVGMFIFSRILDDPATFSVEVNYPLQGQPTAGEQREVLNTIASLVEQEKPAQSRNVLLSMVTTPKP
jgi:hypothetical protein